MQAIWPKALPAGVIHADLFPDNVFFLGDKLSGLIDFYFACNDFLAYDLAICLNSWAFEASGEFNPAKGRGDDRRLPARAAAERRRRSRRCRSLARGSALRFMLTRLVDWLNVPPGALVKPKDPREYLAKLRFHTAVEFRARLRLARVSRVEIWTDGACSGNPGPGGWGAILKFGDERQGAQRRRAADHQQPHGADRRDLGAGGAEAPLRRRSAHRFAISAAGRDELAGTAGSATAGAPPTRSR